MNIHLRGWAAQVALLIAAVFGILAAIVTLLDFLAAYWIYVLPATLVYAAVLWAFVTPKAEPGTDMGEVILTKLFITILLLAASVVAIVVVVWVCHLVADNWPYVVIAAVIVAGILISAVVVGILDDRKKRRQKLHHQAGHDPSGHDHAASLTPPEGHAR